MPILFHMIYLLPISTGKYKLGSCWLGLFDKSTIISRETIVIIPSVLKRIESVQLFRFAENFSTKKACRLTVVEAAALLAANSSSSSEVREQLHQFLAPYVRREIEHQRARGYQTTIYEQALSAFYRGAASQP